MKDLSLMAIIRLDTELENAIGFRDYYLKRAHDTGNFIMFVTGTQHSILSSKILSTWENLMSDIKNAKQLLTRYKNLRDNWLLKGYDTPQLTYHEQLDEYNLMIERLENFIENGVE
jgi:hypothetical protein